MSDSTKRLGIPRRGFLGVAPLLAPVLAESFDGTTENPTSQNDQGITGVGAIRVGHYTDARRPTGCTVILFDQGAVAGVDVRGSAPGTRETDLLNPVNTVEKVNAILLSGGSAFGLDAATGVMRYLEEHRRGFHVGSLMVPIVPAAILFDLELGDSKIRPDAASGYAACSAASDLSVAEGNVGAGAGGTVGKLFGTRYAMKSGLGTACVSIGGTGIKVGAIAAVNAVGDVYRTDTETILAGARAQDGRGFRNSMRQIMNGYALAARKGENSTIGVVATNAVLNKSEATKMAQVAHDGLARTIRPVHTLFDGDTIFAAATGTAGIRADAGILGAIAAEVLARTVNRAVLSATGIPGYPAYRDLPR
jgi:L-aminopeptidase/D-esterase-like protein